MRRLAALVLALILLTGCAASPISVGILAEDRDFGLFQASAPDPEEARRADALVQAVLAEYPEGFPAQWGPVQILLVGNLTGQAQFSGGNFAGFTQKTPEGWLMVLDAARCDAGTVHHEIAHILDGILTEAGALTEADWMDFCPGGFVYGQGNFADYPDFFADAYAMQNLKEDRARTFEDAMLSGAGVYADRPALWLKLDSFSRAIRAHFDTTGWPEKTAWEQVLERIN